jgi:thiol-disulfide isomerase/thioredoxin
MKNKNENTIKLGLFTFHFLLSTSFSFAQDSIRISGQLLNNTRFAKVVVSKFGVGSFPIAAVPIQEEKFSLTAPGDIEPGVYRFQYSQTASEYVDVIINGKEKEIAFSVDVVSENKVLEFSQSKENQLWYNYQNQSQVQLQKIEMLNQFAAMYPSATDKIVTQATKALALEKENYTSQKDIFLKNNSTTLAALMEQNRSYYFTNPKDDWRIQNYDKHQHFWDNVNTTNPELINTPLYTELILEYLKYYLNPEMQFSEEEMNQGLKKCVNTIMQNFSGNEKTQKFALHYMQLGFKEIGNEEVLQYLDQNFQELAEQCQDGQEKADFDLRMAGYKAMKEGNLAPNIDLDSTSSLHEMISKQILIVFWASWCPHCQEELPKVNTWAKDNPDTKVLAISLDDDKTAYEEAIKQLPNLIHHTDLKKWEGQTVKDYYVYATPTFLLLDRNKKIIKKASSLDLIVRQ